MNRELGKELKEKIIQKVKSDKKQTFFIVLVMVIVFFFVANRFDGVEKHSQKNFETKITKEQKLDEQLLKLKLDQKATNFGIPKLHESDKTIVDYRMESFKNDTRYKLADGTNRHVNVPKHFSVVKIIKNDNSVVYYHNNHYFTPVQ